MVEETFIASTPREAFELAREKYGRFSNLKLLKAIQVKDNDNLLSKITVSVSSTDFLDSIGIDEEAELAKEIGDLKTEIDSMRNILDPSRDSEEIESIKKLMIERGVGREWLESILSSIAGTSIIQDEELVLSYILDEIDEQLSIKVEDFNKPKMMMLIGSTGVGKTTTVAKLAARYSLILERPLKVALINLDSFRVGAYEQLKHYAEKMQIEHIRVGDTDEFSQALDRLNSYDITLIDTAGISPYDTNKLIKTIEFLKSSQEYDIETSLVISATAKRDDILDMYDHFSFLNIDNIILTKFDETRRVGELFSTLIEKGVPVSYISSGQGVPDNLVPATKSILMDRFVSELNV